jgi:hypothetical protein
MASVPRSWQVQAWRAYFTAPHRNTAGHMRLTKIEFKSGRQLYLVKEGGQLVNIDTARKAGKL